MITEIKTLESKIREVILNQTQIYISCETFMDLWAKVNQVADYDSSDNEIKLHNIYVKLLEDMFN